MRLCIEQGYRIIYRRIAYAFIFWETASTDWREFMSTKASAARTILVILIIVALSSTGLACAVSPTPATGDANVDGFSSEWDLSEGSDDFFAPMYRAGNPAKPIQSNLYLRYDPSDSTLYVLVLTLDAYPGLREADEAWIKIDGVKKVDGNYPAANFAWVEFDPSVANVRGFEAKFTLPPGQYLIDAHINVLGSEPPYSETSRTINTQLFINVIPEGSMLALMISLIAAFGLFVAHNRKKP